MLDKSSPLLRRWLKNSITEQKTSQKIHSKIASLLQRSTTFLEESQSNKRTFSHAFVSPFLLMDNFELREPMYPNRNYSKIIWENSKMELYKNMISSFLINIGKESIQRSSTNTMVSQFLNFQARRYILFMEYGLPHSSTTSNSLHHT